MTKLYYTGKVGDDLYSNSRYQRNQDTNEAFKGHPVYEVSTNNLDEKKVIDLDADLGLVDLADLDSLRVSLNDMVGRSTPDSFDIRQCLLVMSIWSGRIEVVVLDVVLVIFRLGVGLLDLLCRLHVAVFLLLCTSVVVLLVKELIVCYLWVAFGT